MMTRILVPGRGVEGAESDFPGTVQPDSLQSCDSYYRALAAVDAANADPTVQYVYFSGNRTFVVPPELAAGTEAQAMEDVAVDYGIRPGVRTRALKTSMTTYGNMLEAAEWLKPNQETGVVFHEDHARRGMKIARFVLPEYPLRLISVTNPPEAPPSEHKLSDRLAAVVYGIGMLGIRAGDRQRIKKRDEAIQRRVLGGLAIARRAKGFINRIGESLQPVE